MNTEIFEAAGPLGGLPKHWIKYLANRWGKNSGYSGDMAGEHSTVTPIKQFDPGKIRKALKDSNNLAVIGKVDGEPLFMITPHHTQTTKFSIFEVKPGEGYHHSKGVTTYRGGRSRRSRTSDSYNINEVVDILDQLFQAEGKDFKGMTIEAISKDPTRKAKAEQRQVYKNLPSDPLYSEEPEYQWRERNPSKAQIERGKKYGALKRPKLDAKVEAEKQKIKDQINDVIDGVLDGIIKDIKRGYASSFDKATFARKMADAINIAGIQNVARAYNALGSDYDRKQPIQMAKELKQTGLM